MTGLNVPLLLWHLTPAAPLKALFMADVIQFFPDVSFFFLAGGEQSLSLDFPYLYTFSTHHRTMTALGLNSHVCTFPFVESTVPVC